MSSSSLPAVSVSELNVALTLINGFAGYYKSSEDLSSKLATHNLAGKAEAVFDLMIKMHKKKGGRTAKKFAKFTPGKLYLMYANDDSFVVAACIGDRKCAIFDGKSVEVTRVAAANKKYSGASYARKVCFKYSK